MTSAGAKRHFEEQTENNGNDNKRMKCEATEEREEREEKEEKEEREEREEREEKREENDNRMEIEEDVIAQFKVREIVSRALIRQSLGQNLLPRTLPDKQKRTTPELEQEHKDAQKLNAYKIALKGKSRRVVPEQVCSYLDNMLPEWRLDVCEKALKDAHAIVERAKRRVLMGLPKLPRKIKNRDNPLLIQEYKDAHKLSNWVQTMRPNSVVHWHKCPKVVCDYLDAELSGWRDFYNMKHIKHASAIVERAKERARAKEREKERETEKEKEQRNNAAMSLSLPKLQHCQDSQELEDALILAGWKNQTLKCPTNVIDFLNREMPGWTNVSA